MSAEKMDALHTALLRVLNDPTMAQDSVADTSVVSHDVSLSVALERLRRDPASGPHLLAMADLHTRRIVEAIQAHRALQASMPITH